METRPEKLGKLLKERRKLLGLTLENVEVATIKLGMRVSAGFLSDTERAYPRKGGSVTLPSDDKLRALSQVLDIPMREMYAALGRVPSGSPAAQLVREELATYKVEGSLAPDDLDDLTSEVEDFARVRVERVMRQFQSQSQSQGGGKQLQRQG